MHMIFFFLPIGDKRFASRLTAQATKTQTSKQIKCHCAVRLQGILYSCLETDTTETTITISKTELLQRLISNVKRIPTEKNVNIK